jgi:monovalent cation/hydrogen antiporter
MAEEPQQVRSAMRTAAIAAIDTLLANAKAPSEWADQLRMEIANRVALSASEGLEQPPKNALLLQLRRAVVEAERKELIRLWRGNEISDEVKWHQEEILDYQEAQL